MISTVGITETISLKPGKEGDRFQLLEPFPSEVYKGPLVSNDDVKPAPVGGTWYPAKPTTFVGGPKPLKVALHFHGGAFVMGNSRPGYGGFFASTLLSHAGFDAVFAITYRLSGYGKTNPFPAALQDALTSYLYLVRTLGIPSENIVLVGDSAGGNLVIGLLRYFQEFGHDLQIGLPGQAVLIAPWVNPLEALGPDSLYTTSPYWHTDHIPVSFLRWGARTYGGEELVSEPYVTALGHPFATSVPLVVGFGEVEVLQSHGLAWVEEMKAVPGNKVETRFEPHGVHDTMLLGSVLGWEDSARGMASQLGDAIAKVDKDIEV